jgi:asparagine synthase (glutamine-hydrolysing)
LCKPDEVIGDEEVLGLLDQANRRTLVADCPVAVGFSGGIDSSVVLKAAMEGADVAAVVTVFSAPTADEDVNLHRSREVAQRFGVELVEVPFTLPSFDDTVDLLNATLDQPSAEPLVLHNDALHVAASAHAKVVLGGHGADEVFGGYARYAALAADGGRSATRRWMGASEWERWRRAAGWASRLAALVSDEFAAAVDPDTDALDRPFPYDHAEHTDPVLFGQALDLFRLMSYDNFRATDENGITRGVEVRSPFFDIDLIAGVFALPLDRRIVPGTSKHLLRQVFAGTPLARSFDVGKVGFDDHFPYPAWISANWADFSAAIVDGPLGERGVLSTAVLGRLAELDWRLKWRLFTLSTWLMRRQTG